MIFGRWNIIAIINNYKEDKFFSELCHIPVDPFDGNDKYPTSYATRKGMNYFEALSIYLKFSKLGIYSMIVPMERELNEFEKKEKTKRLLITGGICTAVVVALFLVLHFTYFVPLNKYNDAVKMINTGKYEQAIKAFEEMGDYRDAPLRIKQAKASILYDEGKLNEAYTQYSYLDPKYNQHRDDYENMYKRAVKQIESGGNYDWAEDILQKISDYKDSLLRIKQAEANQLYDAGQIAQAYDIYSSIDPKYNQHSKDYETKYIEANQLQKDGKLEEAARNYQSLGKYKDSKEKYREVANLLIEQYESQRSYAKAAEIYQILGMDAEAQQEIVKQGLEDDYRLAVELMNSADYVVASNSFMELGDYEDSQALKIECDYLSGKALMDEGFYTGAIECFGQLEGYKDSQALTNECMYLYAGELAANGSSLSAEKIYRELGDYQDSAQKADEIKQALIDQMKKDMVFSVGNTFIFGRYEQDGLTGNGKEPLEWIVIWKNADKAFVTTKYAIECIKYQSPKRNITWEHSMVRAWLNNDFYRNAFSEAERESICKTAVSNTFGDGKYNTESGRNTYDYIYLLSYYEVSNYFKSDEERKLIPTEIAKKNGAHYLNCYWMTRSPGSAQDQVMAVKDNGQTNYSTGVDDAHLGVRPAMWIKLDEPRSREAMFTEGSIVSFGGATNNDGVFVPLRWRVIDKEEDAVTLLAEKVVDNRKFNEERESVTWKDSSLRKFMNSTFINSVFNNNEKESLMIMNVKLDSRDGIEGYRSMPTIEVEDKVTLLSYKQAWIYLGDKEQRKIRATEYASKQGAGNGNTEYWLTSMGRDEKTMGIINGNGDPDSRSVTDKKGVLPMIKVSLSFGLE